jgi:hypothetical protein
MSGTAMKKILLAGVETEPGDVRWLAEMLRERDSPPNGLAHAEGLSEAGKRPAE